MMAGPSRLCHVGSNPDGHAGRVTHPRLRPPKGRIGNIQHSQTIEPASRECIDKPTITPAYVQHARLGRQTSRFHELQRYGRDGLKPTDLSLALRRVDALPMVVTVHDPMVLLPSVIRILESLKLKAAH
jgi:predicted amidohydrolase